LNRGKFSRALATLAKRNAGCEYRSNYLQDCARSRFEGQHRSAATRHRRVSASNPRLFCKRNCQQTIGLGDRCSAIRNPQWLGWIESELRSDAFGVSLCLAAVLLRRCLEGTQTADLLKNPLGVQLVFQP